MKKRNATEARSETEESLRERWGKDIPVYDELDPNYIPVNEDWLPIPMILDERVYRKTQSAKERLLTAPTGITVVKIGARAPKKKTPIKKRRRQVVQY